MTHPPDLRLQAKKLRKQGMLVADIAAEIGVPKPTVIRWTNPRLEKRERAKARHRKFSKGRQCPRCKSRPVSNNAKLCRPCRLEIQTTSRYWTRERVIEAIQLWYLEKGHPPVYAQWERSGPGHPAISSILDGPNPPFKKWSEAIQAAGFTPRVRRPEKKRPLTLEEKQRRAALRRTMREEKIRKAMQEESHE